MKQSLYLAIASLVLLPAIARAQWTQTNGPYGGEVKGFAQDSAGTLFAAVDPGGVFFSTDKGVTWQRRKFSLIDTSIYCIAVSGNTLFAGSTRGMLTSTNGGESWKKRESGPLSFFGVGCIGVSGNAVFASDAGGLYRTKDLGDTWAKIDSGLGSKNIQAIAMMGSLVFAGVSKDGIYRSADEGTTWTPGNTGLPSGDKYVYSLVAKDTKLIACVSNGGVFLSTDSAKTWSPMNSHLFKAPSDLAVKGDTLFVAADSGNIFMTDDDGENWVRLHKTPYYAPINTLIAGAGFILAGRRGDGVLRSGDDGATWAVSNKGMTALRVEDLMKFRGNLYAATNGNWISRTKDFGGSWTVMNSGYTPGYGDRFVDVLGKSGENLLAGGSNKVLLSSDEGLTWKSSASNYPSDYTSFTNLGRYVFGGAKDGIFRSPDNGATWTRVKENKYGVNDAAISAIAADDNAVYAKSQTTFLISRDSGASWTNFDFVLPKINGTRPLAVSGNALFTASDPGIFRSTDQVTTWSPVNNGLRGSDPSSRLPAFSILTEYQGNLFARSNDGAIFLTRNQGDTWVKADSSLPVKYVTSLVADGEHLYAGTTSGVWRRSFPLTPVQVKPARESIPGTPADRLTVSAPEAGAMNIAYQVSRPQRVSIRILTLSGLEAARPLDGTVAAGSHSLVWDARSLDAGCYHIVMRTGNRTIAKRAAFFR